MKKSKKQLRKEATELANRIHRNLSHANGITNLLDTAPALEKFTSITVPNSGTDQDTSSVLGSTIKFHNSPLPPQILDSCLNLFKANMGTMYEKSSWGLDMKAKREELTHPNARFLIATFDKQRDGDDDVLAFAHFRFEVDDDDQPTREVLYLYEIQISSASQRSGLGKRMMQILEIVAMQMKMRMVMLTVFKNNQNAMKFYLKLKYQIDEISPSQFEEEADYEIMSKCVYKGTD